MAAESSNDMMEVDEGEGSEIDRRRERLVNELYNGSELHKKLELDEGLLRDFFPATEGDGESANNNNNNSNNRINNSGENNNMKLTEFFVDLFASLRENRVIREVLMHEGFFNLLSDEWKEVLCYRIGSLRLLKKFAVVPGPEGPRDFSFKWSVFIPLLNNAKKLRILQLRNVAFESKEDVDDFANNLAKRKETVTAFLIENARRGERGRGGNDPLSATPILSAAASMTKMQCVVITANEPGKFTVKSSDAFDLLTGTPTLEAAQIGNMMQGIAGQPAGDDESPMKIGERVVSVDFSRNPSMGLPAQKTMLNIVRNNPNLTKVWIDTIGGDDHAEEREGSVRIVSELMAWLELNRMGKAKLLEKGTSRRQCAEILAKLSGDVNLLFLAMKTRPDACLRRGGDGPDAMGWTEAGAMQRLGYLEARREQVLKRIEEIEKERRDIRKRKAELEHELAEITSGKVRKT